jgi:ribosome-associated toxin RatA of RatAB toxin-antitoxin module
MREVRRSALVPYTPQQMYGLVNDVARYPDFVPWCPATRVLAESVDSITATVEIARAGVRLALTTRNSMRPGERIDMRLLAGPLRSFEGSWHFLPILAESASPGEASAVRGCRIELEVRFEFGSAALGVLFGPLFEASWDSLVDAFVERARAVHGR